jgi:hypothetical protein
LQINKTIEKFILKNLHSSLIINNLVAVVIPKNYDNRSLLLFMPQRQEKFFEL